MDNIVRFRLKTKNKRRGCSSVVIKSPVNTHTHSYTQEHRHWSQRTWILILIWPLILLE